MSGMNFDLDRMKRALASPSHAMPSGLSAEEKRQFILSKAGDACYPCNCRGPQNGQPVCPCQMRYVQIKDGRYVRIQDLGPAPCTSA